MSKSKVAVSVSITERVEQLKLAGFDKRKIEAMLTLEDFSPKGIKEALKSEKAAPRNFAGLFYEWLAKENRNPEDVKNYIMGLGEYGETSSNIKNHLSHYTNIADLTRKIWELK